MIDFQDADDRAAIFANLMLCVEHLTLGELRQLSDYIYFLVDLRLRQMNQPRYINFDMARLWESDARQIHFDQPIVIGGLE